MVLLLIISMHHNDNMKSAPLEPLFLLEKEIKCTLDSVPDEYALVAGLCEMRDRINSLFQGKIDDLMHGGASEAYIREQIEASLGKGVGDT